MTGRRIVIAGASGFVGQYLASRFVESGDTVATIGRSGADARWGDAAAIGALLDGSDILINLAGKSVNCRYTRKNMAAIFSSRLLTTAELGESVQAVARPPRVWFNASTATIYRHADDHPMTDETGELGAGFSVNVATAWEREFFAHSRAGVRQVALRMAIVLGDGSALTPLVRLARLGFGGPQFGGKTSGARQRFSWVHIEDVHRAIEFLSGSPDVGDTVNVSSPNPVENRELMATLRRVLGARIGIPLFSWMLEAGAFAIRTETELLLKSRWVVPTRLLAAGFEFEFPRLEGALRDILHK
ncbi:MAG: uncharacterized protein QOH69_2315 [Actinomycetota bacterium]|jgi:uncharacterized protein (TIGR01777 family)|nr:uncharacterized protein [Actinomycetota bacterium]